MNVLKCLAAKNWGADSKVLLNTYRAIVRAKLDYGCIVYNSASATALKMLNTIQTTALRIILGAFHTSPASSLQIETDEPPLELRRKELSLTYAAKLASFPDSRMHSYAFSSQSKETTPRQHQKQMPFNIRVANYLTEFDLKFPVISPHSLSTVEPWKITTPTINVKLAEYSKDNTNSIVYKNKLNEIQSMYPSHATIYTDGSVTKEGNGCAVVFPHYTMLYRLPPCFTIFSCELFAIKQSLKTIVQTNDNYSYIIFTDSLSTITALQDRTTKNSLVQEVQNIYNRIKQTGKQVILTWIPSHIGITGNELADTSAKEASRQPSSDPTITTTYQDAITYIKQTIKIKWKEKWLNNPTSKLHKVRNNNLANTHLTNMNRKQQIAITRMRIGHTKLTHSFLLSKDLPPTCEHCKKNLTVQHIILECDHYDKWRKIHGIPTKLSEALNEEDNMKKKNH